MDFYPGSGQPRHSHPSSCRRPACVHHKQAVKHMQEATLRSQIRIGVNREPSRSTNRRCSASLVLFSNASPGYCIYPVYVMGRYFIYCIHKGVLRSHSTVVHTHASFLFLCNSSNSSRAVISATKRIIVPEAWRSELPPYVVGNR